MVTWATDVGNTYLEAKTKEKLFIIAGPEFGKQQGHTLIIKKALCGLRSSGKMWHQLFSECLSKEAFEPCLAEPEIWMRANGDCYEYVAVYVDYLAYTLKEPATFTKTLMEKYNFKLEGTEPIEFHLGCEFEGDEYGILCLSPHKYIDRMFDGYKQMFGVTLARSRTHHWRRVIILSWTLLSYLTKRVSSSIRASLAPFSLGRLDVTTALMTLSRFRAIPRQGHLVRATRIVGYLAKMKHRRIRFCTSQPDYSDLPEPGYD